MSLKAKIAWSKPSKGTGGPLLSLDINSLRNGRLLTRIMYTMYLHKLLQRCQHTICCFSNCMKAAQQTTPKNHKTSWLFRTSKLHSKLQIVSIANVMCCWESEVSVNQRSFVNKHLYVQNMFDCGIPGSDQGSEYQ